MRQIVEYQTGERYYQDSEIQMGIHGGIVKKIYDLTHATPDEVVKLRHNPHDNVLLADIVKRGIQ